MIKGSFFSLGLWYRDNESPDEAIDAFKVTVELDPSFGEAYNQLAYLYFQRGDFATALDYLKKYSSLNPDEANPFDSMGDLLWRIGELDDAIDQYGKALEIKSDFWPSAAKIAYIYTMKEDYRMTQKWLTKTLNSAWSEGSKANIYQIIAFIFHLSGKSEQSMQLLDASKTISIQSKNDYSLLSSYVLEAIIHYDMGRFDQAQTCSRTFLNIAMNEPTNSVNEDFYIYYIIESLIHIN